jgi:hypothetical protein
MPYTTNEQALYDHLKATLPRWLFQRSNAPEEIWGGYVKLFDAVRTQIDTWASYARILVAAGMWLDAHAHDRGTFRQASESDDALRERLRTHEDMVTLPAIQSKVEAMMTELEPALDPPVFIELARERSWLMTEQGTYGGTTSKPYLSRGYRVAATRPKKIIVILPYGTSASTRAAVDEYLRLHRAAGYTHTLEVRAIP